MSQIIGQCCCLIPASCGWCPQIPATIYGTVTASADGGCNCLLGLVATMNYGPNPYSVYNRWWGSIAGCGSVLTFQLANFPADGCNLSFGCGTDFFGGGGVYAQSSLPVFSSCPPANPFHLIFKLKPLGASFGCCGGSQSEITIELTA